MSTPTTRAPATAARDEVSGDGAAAGRTGRGPPARGEQRGGVGRQLLGLGPARRRRTLIASRAANVAAAHDPGERRARLPLDQPHLSSVAGLGAAASSSGRFVVGDAASGGEALGHVLAGLTHRTGVDDEKDARRQPGRHDQPASPCGDRTTGAGLCHQGRGRHQSDPDRQHAGHEQGTEVGAGREPEQHERRRRRQWDRVPAPARRAAAGDALLAGGSAGTGERSP